MIKPIQRSEIFLRMPCVDATPADAQLAQDMRDTLAAHAHECVGLAANMIGQAKRAICVDNQGRPLVMFNPRITSQAGEFEAQEGCLSLDGVRTATRYERITVEYDDETFAHRSERFTGWTAQIIQHEVDHCNGIVI